MTPEENEAQEPKNALVTIQMTLEDAQRLQQAFSEGKLKELGITEIVTDIASLQKQWSDTVRLKKLGPQARGTPPLP